MSLKSSTKYNKTKDGPAIKLRQKIGKMFHNNSSFELWILLKPIRYLRSKKECVIFLSN